MPSEPNSSRSANALVDLAMKYAGDVPAKIRQFNEGLPAAAVDAGRAIFSKLPPEMQQDLADAASAGGDALHQMVTHVASSPVGQTIGAGLQGIDIATKPLQENYAASQQMMKDMGVQAPSMADNPLFDVADVGPLGNADQALMAFHGSPHRFRKFDAAYIGTGEGAQAFGHGMYFAENPSVARGYVKAGEGSGRLIDAAKGDVIDINALPLSDKAKSELEGLIYTGSTVPDILKSARRNAEASRFWDMQDVNKGMSATREKFASEMDALADLLETGQYTHGVDIGNASLYRVDVPDEYIPKMLDWDKQLYKQPEIQKELEDIALDLYGESPYMKEITPKQYVRQHMHDGEELYTVLSQKLGSDKAASVYLSERGIPGIKYFDAGSRGKEKGTRNFVVFPGLEDKVKMLERNGIPVDSPEVVLKSGERISNTGVGKADPYGVAESEPWALVKGEYERGIAKQFADAQRNAALPVEKGGLGLHPNNTAAERAEAMGFTQPAYHGTTGNFSAFDEAKRGSETGAKSAKLADFASSSPTVASGYSLLSNPRTETMLGRAYDLAKERGDTWYMDRLNEMMWDDPVKPFIQPPGTYSLGDVVPEGANVMPLLINTKGFSVDDFKGGNYRDKPYSSIVNKAKEEGLPGAVLKNTDDSAHKDYIEASDIISTLEQNRMRSKYAAFDPLKRDELGLMKARGGLVKGYAKGDIVSIYNDYHDTSFKDRAMATLASKRK